MQSDRESDEKCQIERTLLFRLIPGRLLPSVWVIINRLHSRILVGVCMGCYFGRPQIVCLPYMGDS